MAKDKLTDYDSTAANNLDVGGISVAEGMLPSGVNNAIRELMSHQADAFGAGTPLYVDQTNNRVGIGNAAPTTALTVDADGATVATFDRATSDGTVIDVQKDGSSIGVIGVVNSDLYIADNESCGVRFTGSELRPVTHTGANADNTIDLGDGTVRYKDLYLGGGVYLGGTGSANYLDDYEEGTFTPYFLGSSSNPTVTYSVQQGSYIKVGKLVLFNLRISPSTVSGGSGNLWIDGLPFTSSSSYTFSGAVALNYSWGININPAAWLIDANSTYLNLYKLDNSAPAITVSNLSTTANYNRIYVQGHYWTS